MPSEVSPPKIRVVIVDDEPPARSNLRLLLKAESEVVIAGECGSGKEALEVIRRERPDLVFLDVQMPECDGFEVLERLGTLLPPALIFVTAYEQYAIRAFEAGALDYLLKPFDDARFSLALRRGVERVRQGSGKSAAPPRFAIRSVGSVLFVGVPEIDWVEAQDYYVSLHVGKASHLLRRSMTDVASELDPAQFCRVHRSAIVNLSRVRRIDVLPDGGHQVLLNDGTELPLSRRYRKELEARLGARAISSSQ